MEILLKFIKIGPIILKAEDRLLLKKKICSKIFQTELQR